MKNLMDGKTMEEYTATSSHCPFCGSQDVSAGGWDAEARTQEVSCSACGVEYVDTYELTGYIDMR